MITYIKIGGRQRPIAFGYKVAYDYEINTGKSYNELLMAVSDMFLQSAAAMTGSETGAEQQDLEDVVQFMGEERRRALSQFSIVPLTNLVYYGMLYAHRKEGLDIDFEASDVAEWIFSDRAAMTSCLRILMDASPSNGADDSASKKNKMGPSIQSTGARLSKRRPRLE